MSSRLSPEDSRTSEDRKKTRTVTWAMMLSGYWAKLQDIGEFIPDQWEGIRFTFVGESGKLCYSYFRLGLIYTS